MVGNQPAIFGVALNWVRGDVGVSVDAHRFAVKGNDLLRAGVVEVEHMVDLAFEEECRTSVRLKLETEPEEGALTCPVPIAANEVRVAAEGMGWPRLKQPTYR